MWIMPVLRSGRVPGGAGSAAARIILIASVAAMDPINVTMGPMIPAVSHVGTVPGAGSSPIVQRRQGVSPGRMVMLMP